MGSQRGGGGSVAVKGFLIEYLFSFEWSTTVASNVDLVFVIHLSSTGDTLTLETHSPGEHSR